MLDRVSLWKQKRLCPNSRNARKGTKKEEKARSTLLSVMTSMIALSRGDEERDAGPGNWVSQGFRGPMNEGAWSIKHSGDVCRGSCPQEEDEHWSARVRIEMVTGGSKEAGRLIALRRVVSMLRPARRLLHKDLSSCWRNCRPCRVSHSHRIFRERLLTCCT